jgi:hypothetical protein
VDRDVFHRARRDDRLVHDHHDYHHVLVQNRAYLL